jgi:hypothetical protein
MASTKTLNVFLIEAVIAAQGDATTALADATTAVTAAGLAQTDATAAQGAAEAAQGAAEAAQTTATQALTDALSAQATADSASAAAAAAQGAADTASADAATAQSTAEAAQDTAEAAQDTADSAATDAAAAVITADLASVTAFSHFPTVSSLFYDPDTATPEDWIADFVAGKVVIFQPTASAAITHSFFSQTTNGLVFRLGNDNSVSSNHILTINDGSNDIVEIAPSEYITLFYNSYSSVPNYWDKWIKFPGIINGVYPTAPPAI